MALNLSFFRTPKHRVFNYQPLYYDEKKEAMAERYARVHEDEKGNDVGYIPGRLVRSKLRKAVYGNRRNAGSVLLTRMIIAGSIVVLIFVAYYFAKSFGLFFSLIS